MNDKTVKDLAELVRDLGALMNDPQPGLLSWNDAVFDVVINIGRLLRVKLWSVNGETPTSDTPSDSNWVYDQLVKLSRRQAVATEYLGHLLFQRLMIDNSGLLVPDNDPKVAELRRKLLESGLAKTMAPPFERELRQAFVESRTDIRVGDGEEDADGPGNQDS